jgi:hypothetical protein
MLYMLRYEDELRDPKSALSGVKEAPVDAVGEAAHQWKHI